MVGPEGEHLGFHIEPTTLANDGHGEQFAVACTGGLRTRAAQERLQLETELIHDERDPQAKVVKIRYDHGVLPVCGGGRHPIHSSVEDGLSNRVN